ncbi:ribonuclease Z [Bacillus sp. HMF5848]|uniref:ribonuclease Z n=1 Tax=Bacillus sp. HMF5848 TaxID=2495421 RepID=UPI000F77EFBC|nr:ribonuclease Z [Bacillus sp. HMF5848]RSK27749.1 ribonuclease Z [Bacillus sp. HMF5848]
MELIFLGTGAGVPGKQRNVSAIALSMLQERGAVWLFDCGEATQHQILHTNIRPRRIEHIYITHLHGDHIFGLPGLLGSRSFQGGNTPLTVFGPEGIKSFIETSLAVSQTHLQYELHVKEIEEGIIYEDSGFKVEAIRLQHGIPSFGYRVIEKDLPGELLVDKLKELGIPPGPMYQKIKNGSTVEWQGAVLRNEDFLSAAKKGRIVALAGDTRYCDASVRLGREADVLVHEATFAEDKAEIAYNYFHTTAKQAAAIALEAQAKRLIMTHISSRYQPAEEEQLLIEAKEIFKNTSMAKDFYKTEIPKR